MATMHPLLARILAIPAPMRIAAAAGLAAIVLLSIVSGIATHAPRVELFANALHPDQLGEVEDELAAWSVPFTPNGENVVVDPARRNEILLRLSLAGVPHAHVATTSEALANVGVLTPQSVIDAQTRSGLAGDVEMGLRSIDGVEDANVIVAPAQTAEFADEHAHDATASVRLHMRPGARLSPPQVAGIRAFVAASVPELDPARVTIVDDRGLALSDAPASGDDAQTLQASLQSALDAAFGTGVAIVRVNEERTHTSSDRRETLRLPAGAAAIAHSIDAESYDDGGKRYRKNDERDDRGSDTRETTTHSAPGGVARITTAVFIDASRGVDLARVRELAAATVGYDVRRGDELNVAAVDFHRAAQPRRDGWFVLYGALAQLLPTLAVLVVVLVVAKASAPAITSLVRAALDRAAIERTTRTVAGYAPAQVRGALASEPPHAAAAIISALPAATAAAVLELYPPHEREAIVTRMQRVHASIVPEPHEIFGRHA